MIEFLKLITFIEFVRRPKLSTTPPKVDGGMATACEQLNIRNVHSTRATVVRGK
jgi:hypothetical protein